MRPNKKSDEQILRQYPQMKELVILLCRDPDIDQLVQNTGPPRRQSSRIAANLKVTATKAAEIIASNSTPTTRRSSNKMLRSANAQKSILKGGMRLRNRSKSVYFDLNGGASQANRLNLSLSPVRPVRRSSFSQVTSPFAATSVQSIAARQTMFNQNTMPVAAPAVGLVALRRDSFSQATSPFATTSVPNSVSPNEFPVDLTTRRNSEVAGPSGLPIALTAQMAGFSSVEASSGGDDSVANYVEISSGENSGHTSGAHASSDGLLPSSQILAYENRICGLVEANRAKVNRIKDLLAERAVFLVDNTGLLAQVESLHRINHSLAETVDMFREQDENGRPGQPLNGNNGTNTHQNENIFLRDRIDILYRENVGLKKENDKLNAVLSTHSKKVLSEHNYNL